MGNDGRRDYAALIEAARAMPQESFTVVTRMEPPAALPANVAWRRGDWRGQAVSDEELRELYRSAACVVVPLLESPQPSGQSVAMQAMMCGAPVVHTRTAGWWGAEIIRAGEHIFLVEPRSPSSLEKGIGKAVSAGMAGNNARSALLSAQWTTKGFAERIGALVERSSALS